MLRKYVTSTNVRSVGYLNRTLEVEFSNGSVYQYFNVPVEHYNYMAHYPHPGTYLAQHVKGRYQYVRIR